MLTNAFSFYQTSFLAPSVATGKTIFAMVGKRFLFNQNDITIGLLSVELYTVTNASSLVSVLAHNQVDNDWVGVGENIQGKHVGGTPSGPTAASGYGVDAAIYKTFTVEPNYVASPTFIRQGSAAAAIGQTIAWEWSLDNPLLIQAYPFAPIQNGIYVRNQNAIASPDFLVNVSWIEYLNVLYPKT